MFLQGWACRPNVLLESPSADSWTLSKAAAPWNVDGFSWLEPSTRSEATHELVKAKYPFSHWLVQNFHPGLSSSTQAYSTSLFLVLLIWRDLLVSIPRQKQHGPAESFTWLAPDWPQVAFQQLWLLPQALIFHTHLIGKSLHPGTKSKQITHRIPIFKYLVQHIELTLDSVLRWSSSPAPHQEMLQLFIFNISLASEPFLNGSAPFRHLGLFAV